MSENRKPTYSGRQSNAIELIAVIATNLIPLIVVTLLLFDRQGVVINRIFPGGASPSEAYVKAIIIMVAALASAIVSQRFLQLEKIKKSVADVQDELRARLYPDNSVSPYLVPNLNLEAYIRDTQQEIVLIGINLTSLLGTYRERINAKLAEGKRLSVVVIDPNRENLDAATRRSDVALSKPDYYRSKIETSVLELKQMAATAAKHGHGGSVTLRLLPFVPAFSIRAFDPDRRNGRIVIELYPHRTADSPPAFVLKLPDDQYWYDYFRTQMATMLRDGELQSLGDG